MQPEESNPLGSFYQDELPAVAAALPVEVFAAEAHQRGFIHREELGTELGQMVVAAQEAAEVAQLRSDIHESLFGPRPSAHEQLESMKAFWQRLGLMPPTYAEARIDRIDAKLKTLPDYFRLILFPLLNLDERVAITQRVIDIFQLTKFRPLWVPGEKFASGRLLRSPESPTTVTKRWPRRMSENLGLRYRTAWGRVGRSEFIEKLLAEPWSDEAGGTLWLPSIMDARIETPCHDLIPAGRVHRRSVLGQLPEGLITMHLLHRVANVPPIGPYVHLTDECIYRLDDNGNVVLNSVFGVFCPTSAGQLQLGAYNSNYVYNFQMRKVNNEIE